MWSRVAWVLCIICLLGNESPLILAQDDGERPVITPDNANQVEQLGVLGYGQIGDAAWSPNGAQVAVASSIGILLYDSGQFDTAPYERLLVPEIMTYSVAYSPDGRWLASSSGLYPLYWTSSSREPVTVRLWDTTTNTVAAQWDIDAEWEFADLEFSPDGRQLILYFSYSSIAIAWNVSNVLNVQLIGSRDYNTILNEWYPPLSFDTLNFPNLEGQVVVAASRDHHWIGGIDTVGVVRVWNIEDAREQFAVNLNELPLAVELGKPLTGRGISFSPASSLVLVSYSYPSECGNVVGVWDIETGEEYLWHGGCDGPMFISPDEQHILLLDRFGLKLAVWDRFSNQFYHVLSSPYAEGPLGLPGNFAWSIAFRPGTSELAVARNGAVEFWDTSAQTRIRSLDLNSNLPQIAFSPDGLVLVVYDLREAQFHDAGTLDEIASLETDDSVSDIAFSPDGRLMAVQTESTLFLWDFNDFLERGENLVGMENARLVYPCGAARPIGDMIAFSPDGTMLASLVIADDFALVVWDMQIALVTEEVEIESSQRLPSAVLRYIPLEYPPDSLLPWHVAFSSDGHSLAVDNVIYDTDTWTERFTLTGHTGAVTSVAFSPNGDIIATSSGSTQGWFSNEAPDIPDDTIHLWDAHTGEQLAVLQGHTEGIWQVVFSPDGALLASGSGATINDVSLDGTVRLWGIPSQAIEPNY